MDNFSTRKRITTSLSAIVLGVLFFGVLMGTAISIVSINIRTSPDFAWFPLPVTLLVIAAVWTVEKTSSIGFRPPRAGPRLPWSRIWQVSLLLTLVGVAAAAIQGYFTGYVRATELLDAGVDRGFQRTYAIYLSVLAAVLAEISFRGIMQARMQTVLNVWPTVIIIGLVNVFAHRWGPEITQNGIGLFVVLAAWTYLRWLSRSVWPPLVMHAVTNLIVATWLWNRGPIEHASMTPVAVALLIAAALVCLGLSYRLTRPAHT